MELLIFTIIFLVCLSVCVCAYFVNRKISHHYEVMLRNQRDLFVQILKKHEERVGELRNEGGENYI